MTTHERLTRLLESLVDPGDERYVDPMEPFRDADGGWMLAGNDRNAVGMIPGFNERFLTELRTHCRALAATNEFAINAHENRVNYVVGQGHRYRVVAFDGQDTALSGKVRELIDSFLVRNQWHRRQQEIVRRRDRDGEVFLRMFRDRFGEVSIRFIEPDQVSAPEDYADDPAMSFGIHTEPDDVESVLGYWVDGTYLQDWLVEKVLYSRLAGNWRCLVSRYAVVFGIDEYVDLLRAVYVKSQAGALEERYTVLKTGILSKFSGESTTLEDRRHPDSGEKRRIRSTDDVFRTGMVFADIGK